MSEQEQVRRPTAACLSACLGMAVRPLDEHPGHVATNPHNWVHLDFEDGYELEDGRHALLVEFTVPRGATPERLGYACAVLLSHCMRLAGDDAETVLDGITARARRDMDGTERCYMDGSEI